MDKEICQNIVANGIYGTVISMSYMSFVYAAYKLAMVKGNGDLLMVVFNVVSFEFIALCAVSFLFLLWNGLTRMF